MLSTQIFSKVGKYAQIILAILSIVGISYLVFSPPSSSADDIELARQLRVELDEAVRINGELMELQSDLRGELETGKRTIASLRSIIGSSISENLRAGDLVIESGILVDDSILLLRELRRRLD